VSTRVPSPTVEDYLGAIYALGRDGGAVIEAKLALWLTVTPPTVTATIKRMIRDGWVTMGEHHEIVFTPEGRNAAKSLVRRHMLAEVMLARVLGVEWSKVHQEADGMEHTFSAETTERLDTFLEFPSTCPHGNPLPECEDLLDQLVTLDRAEVDRSWVVARIDEEAEGDCDLMAFLEDHGLVPGAEVGIQEALPFNQTLSVRIDQAEVVLGTTVATHIYVCESARQPA
jgi:DtxR family Mn-dependent transcriptional regulator